MSKLPFIITMYLLLTAYSLVATLLGLGFYFYLMERIVTATALCLCVYWAPDSKETK